MVLEEVMGDRGEGVTGREKRWGGGEDPKCPRFPAPRGRAGASDIRHA